MSSCLIVQQKERIYIGSDSAVSTYKNNKYYRYKNDGKKIFIINNEILFVSGNLKYAKQIVDFYVKNQSIDLLEEMLKKEFSISSSKNFYDIELVIAGIHNNSTYLFQLSQYNHFDSIKYTLKNSNDLNILCAGIHTENLNNIASEMISTGFELHDVFIKSFCKISDETVGGNLTAYCISKNGIDDFLNYKIDDYINPLFYHENSLHLVCADTICGRLLMSQKLIVSNESGSYTIDKDGFTASQTKNGSKYSVKINPDTPDNIFSIAIDDKKLLYVDTTNKALTFEGKIIAKSGTIASFNIADKTLTSGNIGLNSDTTSGQIAFWAGSTDRNNAAFRVSNTGALTCSNATITGGSLKVGDNFSVNPQGILTAAGATVSGKITATSGKIGGWTIDGNSLVGTKGSSYIKGGEINIGSGFFRAYEDQVILGDFEVISTNRGIFQSRDEYSGMSSKTGNGNFVIWGGYNGGDESDPENYAMACNTGGQLYCKELLITTGEDFWQGWTLTATMRDIYSKLERLDDRIDNIDSD